MSLVIDQLDYSYGDVHALMGISVEASPQALTCILGPNASGKSTLLRCIMGRLRPRSGQVLLDGQRTSTLRGRALARRIAYVAQRSTVSASFTVREVVELGRYALTPDRAKIEQAMARLDLETVARRQFAALSVGQQQRVMLARALTQLGPGGYLLLDEPTSALDLRHVGKTMQLLRELVEEGVTVLMVVHDVTLASTYAHQAWLLDEGKLVASGPAADVLKVEMLKKVFRVEFDWFESASGDRLLASQSTRSPDPNPRHPASG